MGLARRGGGRCAAASVVSALALAACSGGGGATVAPPGPTSTTAVTAAPVTTTGAPVPTTVALTPQATPEAAAHALLAAWRRGDRAGAFHLATPEAVETLFARPGQPATDRGCQDPLDGRSGCAFGVGGGVVQVEAAATLLGGWIVESVALDY